MLVPASCFENDCHTRNDELFSSALQLSRKSKALHVKLQTLEVNRMSLTEFKLLGRGSKMHFV